MTIREASQLFLSFQTHPTIGTHHLILVLFSRRQHRDDRDGAGRWLVKPWCGNGIGWRLQGGRVGHAASETDARVAEHVPAK